MSRKSLRAIAYIDGYNLYHGIHQSKKHQDFLASTGAPPQATIAKRLFWLNLNTMCKSIFKDLDVCKIKYFTSRVAGPSPGDPVATAALKEATRLRQVAWLDAVDSLADVEVLEGKWFEKPVTCRACKTQLSIPTEKMTDVQIASEMIADAVLDAFDVAILVSADSDLVPAIKKVKLLQPGKSVRALYPPNRGCIEITNHASEIRKLRLSYLERCRLPDQITRADGRIIHCPADWM